MISYCLIIKYNDYVKIKYETYNGKVTLLKAISIPKPLDHSWRRYRDMSVSK